jgi:hypothetical protein
MTATASRHDAASVVQEALVAVFDATAVGVLREDSPLSSLGFTDADMVCVADAIAAASSSRGVTCVLDDADLVDVVTVADLIDAVVSHAEDPVAQP